MLNPCETTTECPHCYGRFTVHVLGITPCPFCGQWVEVVVLRLEDPGAC